MGKQDLKKIGGNGRMAVGQFRLMSFPPVWWHRSHVLDSMPAIIGHARRSIAGFKAIRLSHQMQHCSGVTPPTFAVEAIQSS